jgi:hypothetical protein
MPRTLGLNIDSESSGCSSSSWSQTDDESLETPFWNEQQGPPAHVWDDDTLSLLQTTGAALELPKASFPMLPSDYSSIENNSSHQSCHFRMEQLDLESVSSDCDDDDKDDFCSRDNPHPGRRPKSWRGEYISSL